MPQYPEDATTLVVFQLINRLSGKKAWINALVPFNLMPTHLQEISGLTGKPHPLVECDLQIPIILPPRYAYTSETLRESITAQFARPEAVLIPEAELKAACERLRSSTEEIANSGQSQIDLGELLWQ